MCDIQSYAIWDLSALLTHLLAVSFRDSTHIQIYGDENIQHIMQSTVYKIQFSVNYSCKKRLEKCEHLEYSGSF